jgi:UDP-N-acetylglucosamine 2-epimerase (non-hydrolysing)
MRRITLVAATRPNFIKIAPLYLCLKQQGWCEVRLLYVAQHPPGPMTTEIARSLGIPEFDDTIVLEDGGSAMRRLGIIADKVHEFITRSGPDLMPDLMVVPGDVDASLAATIAARRAGVPVAHLEAGLRSFDETMPEELNRMLIDSISDLHLPPSQAAMDNLVYGEGRAIKRTQLVGNIMIDTLMHIYRAEYRPAILDQLDLERFALCTFHRPSNVDSAQALEQLYGVLKNVARHHPLLFPVHPRTRANIEAFGLTEKFTGQDWLRLCDPIPYIDFIHLIARSEFVLTDSGGVQEEAAFLKRLCFTFRDNTERPQTIEAGSNHLISIHNYQSVITKALAAGRQIQDIPLWDGLTAERVAQCLRTFLEP